MDPVILSTIIAVLALAIAAYSIYTARRSGVVLTGESATTTLQESHVAASELAAAALTGAQAAEQLWRTGKIERGERLDHAFAYVRRFFPDLRQEQILTAIEGAVPIVNQMFGRPQTGPGEM